MEFLYMETRTYGEFLENIDETGGEKIQFALE